jgi:hypothetical protein
MLPSILTQISWHIEALATAKSDVQLASMIEPALMTFDHFDVRWYNHLVQAGALSVLLNCLERVLSEGESWAIVDSICKLMCMLLRCSDLHASQAIASSEGGLLHLAVAALHMEHRLGESKLSSYISQLVTRLSALQVNLEDMKASSRFLSLCREILEDSTEADDVDLLFFAIQLMAGVVQHQVSKAGFMKHPGLFESLVSSLLKSFEPGSKVNCGIAKLVHTLARHTPSKVIMIKNKGFSKLLVLLLHDSNVDTQLEAMLTFKLLVVERFGRNKLFRDGVCSILDAAVGSCVKLQLCSLKTLLYLISDDTASIIYKRRGFLHQLTNIAKTQSSAEAGLLSAQVIKRLSTYVHVHGRGKGSMLESIVGLLSSTEGPVRYWGLRALLDQSRVKPCSFFLSRTKQIVGMLNKLSRDSEPHTRAIAIEIVFNFATQVVNLPILAKNRELMDSLAVTIAEQGCEDTVARRQAVLVVLCLSRHERSKAIVAKHCSIVESLAKFGVSQDDDNELRGAALHGVIWFAQLL